MDSIFKGGWSLVGFKVSLEFQEQSFSFVLHALTPKTSMDHIEYAGSTSMYVCGKVCMCICVCVCVLR